MAGIEHSPATPMVAQFPETPRGMYCGGNQLVFQGNLKGSAIAGSVRDSEGYALPPNGLRNLHRI